MDWGHVVQNGAADKVSLWNFRLVKLHQHIGSVITAVSSGEGGHSENGFRSALKNGSQEKTTMTQWIFLLFGEETG